MGGRQRCRTDLRIPVGSDPLKTAILHFSGTGNSIAIARLLAGRMDGASVFSVRSLLEKDARRLECEVCGIVFPVYCQDAPEMLQRFLKIAEMPRNAYLFGIATHNGDPGYSHHTLDGILRKKGVRLSAGFAVLMPGNSITPGDSTNSEQEIRKRLEAAPAAVDEIVKCVERRETGRLSGTHTLRKRIKGFRNMVRHRYVHKVPESFWATEECNGCGLCTRICPEGNISLKNDTPEWGNRCQMCLACIHWCPVRAIQNGEGTIRRKRYHHPDVTIEDMLA